MHSSNPDAMRGAAADTATWSGHSLLHTRTEGPADAPPFLVLHDRHGDLGTATALADEVLPPSSRRILVRSARTQTTGGLGLRLGYYWYVGPIERPELSTLGDALYQLEQLIQEKAGSGKIGLVGVGEGAVMALIMAMFWPERTSCVVALDAVWPSNFARMPIENRRLDGVPLFIGGSSFGLDGLALLRLRKGSVVMDHRREASAWVRAIIRKN